MEPHASALICMQAYVMPFNLEEPLYKLVQTCTILYRLVQTCTDFYKHVQTCTILYRLVQTCTLLYRVLHWWNFNFASHTRTDTQTLGCWAVSWQLKSCIAFYRTKILKILAKMIHPVIFMALSRAQQSLYPTDPYVNCWQQIGQDSEAF